MPMTRHYPDLDSASDWLKQISYAARPIRSSSQIWVVTRHQYWIPALVSQTTFRGETKGGVAKFQLNSDVSEGVCNWKRCLKFRLSMIQTRVRNTCVAEPCRARRKQPTAEKKSITKTPLSQNLNTEYYYYKGSYRFLDPKFKTFSTLFSKTIISFSRLKVIKFICRWSIETLKAFLMMHCKHTGKIE